MTCDGYVDGEWYGHQGVQVLEWPALENLLTIDAEACNELRAVFHMLGEQKLTVNDARAKAGLPAMVESDLPVLAEKRPEPPPPLVLRDLSMPELLAKIDSWVARQPSKEPEPPPPLVWPNGARLYAQVLTPTRESKRAKFDNVLNFGGQPQAESATQPSEPQVRSRSAAAKSPLNGVLTEQSGRYCGLGFCDEE
jgi:hypothetical protein